jgi:hypothetical protein
MLETQLRELQQKHTEEMQDLIARHQAEMQKLIAQNEDLEKLIESQNAEKQKLIEQHQADLEKLVSEKAELERQKAELELQKAELERQKAELERNNVEIETSIKELNELMMSEFMNIQKILAENSIEAGNDAVVEAIHLKISSLKKILYDSQSQLRQQPLQSQKIYTPDEFIINLPQGGQNSKRLSVFYIITTEAAKPESSLYSNGHKIIFDDLQKMDADALKNLYTGLQINIKQQITDKLMQKGGKPKSKKRKPKTKKNKRINKMRRTNKHRKLRGGWTYKGSPSLDSKSSVITESSKTKSGKSKSRSSKIKSNKKHKSKKVIRRYKR